jgi:hypothetical protein
MADNAVQFLRSAPPDPIEIPHPVKIPTGSSLSLRPPETSQIDQTYSYEQFCALQLVRHAEPTGPGNERDLNRRLKKNIYDPS